MINKIAFKALPKIAIDLGTSTIKVQSDNTNDLIEEPSVLAYNHRTKRIVAVGSAAKEMMGRTPEYVEAKHPLKNGVISDFQFTQLLLDNYIQRVVSGRNFLTKFFGPVVVIAVPTIITEVEINSIVDAVKLSGISKIFVVEEPIVSALGAGIDVEEASGQMIVDFGGGTTDISIISLGSIVVDNTIKIAGDAFDEAIIEYIKNKYSVMIGKNIAEDLKIKYADLSFSGKLVSIDVAGRDLVSGLPRRITINNKEISEAIMPKLEAIIAAIIEGIEKAPSELSTDIFTSGIVLSGGGALIKGIDSVISKKIGVSTKVCKDPKYSVINGLTYLVNDWELLSSLEIKDLILK